MTAEEIKALSYRELDALIHERYFPWDESCCRVCGNKLSTKIRTLYGRCESCTAERCGGIPGDWKRADELPPPAYSTDPAASKALRDRMRELGWMFRMVYSGGLYLCQFANESGEFGYTTDTEERGWAEAAALATLGEKP